MFKNITVSPGSLQLRANKKAAIRLRKPKGYPQMSAGPHGAAFANGRRVSQIKAVTPAQELREHVVLSHWASSAGTSLFQAHPKS